MVKRKPPPAEPSPRDRRVVERVQTGVRLERRLLGVLKALADFHGITLGDLLEGICLHSLEGKTPFGDESLERVRLLREAFGLDLDASDAHQLTETASRRRGRNRGG